MITRTIENVKLRLTEETIRLHCRHCPIAKIGTLRLRVDRNGLLLPGRPMRVDDAIAAAATIEPPSRAEVAAVFRLLREYPPQLIATPTVSSYRLKHVFQRLLGDYVSNGATILALSRAGIRQESDGLNTRVTTSRRWLTQIEQLQPASLSHLREGSR